MNSTLAGVQVLYSQRRYSKADPRPKSTVAATMSFFAEEIFYPNSDVETASDYFKFATFPGGNSPDYYWKI